MSREDASQITDGQRKFTGKNLMACSNFLDLLPLFSQLCFDGFDAMDDLLDGS